MNISRLAYMLRRYRHLFIVLSMLLSAVSACSQETNKFDMFSPKLRRFLSDHPPASQSLKRILVESFAARTVQLYYFYTEDDSLAKAFHYYPETNAVVIAIRENQQPLDEFICIAFEALNSENEAEFQALCHRAQLGTISKGDFSRDILKVEFKAEKRLRVLVDNLKLRKSETSKSYHFKGLIECPDTFEDYLFYTKKSLFPRDPIKEYETQYDTFRNHSVTNCSQNESLAK